ncbi:hypothetical protein Glove_74g160 [Diversispora epigaea]|uniref:Uncharacterized protein n=1 Tax=Diversispora epigaea TaxID=1348612 RepID=A0A397JKB5_9GLOM|nr:hypothetical protein Glove_74g160 [Diversispora epigaea]
MANTQSKIESLEEQISKLVVENDKLRRENAERGVEIAKLKAESLQEVKTRERIEKTMLDLDGFSRSEDALHLAYHIHEFKHEVPSPAVKYGDLSLQ